MATINIIVVNRAADEEEEAVAGDYPRDDEEAKYDVRGGLVTEVFQDFGGLDISSQSSSITAEQKLVHKTYSENDICDVHDTENDVSNP